MSIDSFSVETRRRAGLVGPGKGRPGMPSPKKTYDEPIEKIYYSIGEVAKMFKVAPSLIRFWESEFRTIQPKKNKKGNRQFTISDIECVREVYQLLKVERYTIEGARIKLKNG